MTDRDAATVGPIGNQPATLSCSTFLAARRRAGLPRLTYQQRLQL